MPRRNKRVTIRATSVPELHQWLRACKRENARKNHRGIMGRRNRQRICIFKGGGESWEVR